MRIAFITSHLDRSTQWLWFSEELQKKDVYHVHIFIGETPPILFDDLKQIDIPTYFLNFKNNFSLLINIFKTIHILRSEKIDIVHTEMPYGNIVGQLAGFLLGLKRVNTCENASWAIDYNSKKQFIIDKLAYFLAHKIIVLTELSREFLIKNYKIRAERIFVIGHSIKTESYENICEQKVNSLKAKYNIGPNDFILGMVSRLEEWKGHKFVIDAVADLKNKHPNIKLLIFGNAAEYKENLLQYIHSKHLEDIVKYNGVEKDNITLYKVFDIHIHVPINEIVETFGISIIEGMISEVPQILTKSGISCFTIKHLENCIEVPYKNSEAIKDAIVMLIENKELGSKLAAQAKKDAIEMFSYEAKVEKHMTVYNSIF
jgi:glycosyltransferase involved in cell wall biosynthesis